MEFVEKEVTKNGFDVRLREGERESTWVLIDMNEVVVHIFTEDARSTYRLEALWLISHKKQCNKYEDVLMTSSFQTRVVS